MEPPAPVRRHPQQRLAPVHALRESAGRPVPLAGETRPMSARRRQLLQVSGLRKSFTGPDGIRKPIVEINDFAIAVGEHVALRGERGSGKTTFHNLISGILPPYSGSIRIGPADMAALGEHARGTGCERSPPSGISSRPSTCSRATPASRTSCSG